MNTLKRLVKEEKAAIVLEYSIVLPLTFLVLFGVMLIGFILHQQACVESAAKRGAIYAARIISDPQYAISTAQTNANNTTDILDHGDISVYNFSKLDSIQPYRYFSSEMALTAGKVKAEVKRIVDSTSTGLRDYDEDNISYNQENKLFFQKVTVEVKDVYDLPDLLTMFGLPDTYDIDSQAIMVVNDPDDFIRNTDYAVDLMLDVYNKTGLSSLGDKVSNNISSTFNKISDFIGDIFN